MTTKFRQALPLALAALLSGCVPVPQDQADVPPPIAAERPAGQPFPLLDPGGSELSSLHFKVLAYGPDQARQISEQAEQAYQRIMVDTNLFSFQQSRLYQIVVYGSRQEYQRKTGQPSWSGGCALGNSIYTFAGPRLYPTVAHEMTHLIWFEYMGRADSDSRWVNEGLAVYEELKAAGSEESDPFASIRSLLRSTPLTMDQMTQMVPASERRDTVSLWYAQAESMVAFMIERGGRMGFSAFLAAVRDNRPWDDAVRSAFPGVWNSLPDFYAAWQRSLQ
ncbi:MAG: hypothetical protein KGK30_00920 [Elusimicrobia bacterium]|nr:hypothetical protein [Elusimicrobiota bacterium]